VPRENAYTKCQHRNSLQIAKQKAIIDAQAEAEKTRELAKGEADAILQKNGSRSVYMNLTKQEKDTKK
jgi:flotillin